MMPTSLKVEGFGSSWSSRRARCATCASHCWSIQSRPAVRIARSSCRGSQDDASSRKNEELGKVQRYLVGEIQTYANAQGFDLVLGDGVFFAKQPLDITAAVLQVLQTKPAVT